MINCDEDLEAFGFGRPQEFPILETCEFGVTRGLAFMPGEKMTQALIDAFVKQ